MVGPQSVGLGVNLTGLTGTKVTYARGLKLIFIVEKGLPAPLIPIGIIDIGRVGGAEDI